MYSRWRAASAMLAKLAKSITEQILNYLEHNKTYWEKGYNAVNVDHPVFRFYGRILVQDFPEALGGKLVDFGCGQGAAVDFFVRHGFNACGVDISQNDISVGQIRYPNIASRLKVVDPDPRRNAFYGF